MYSKILKCILFMTFGLVSYSTAIAQSFSVDVARYLLANEKEIARAIDLQAAVISHERYGEVMIDAWNSNLPGDWQQRQLDDFILYRIAQSQDIDLLGLARSASEIRSSRHVPVRMAGGRELPARERDTICLLPYAPFTLLALSIDFEPMSEEDVAVLKRAFEQFAPRYGALLETMERNGIYPDSSHVSRLDYLSMGFVPANMSNGECGPIQRNRRTWGVDYLFPHLVNNFDHHGTTMTQKHIGRFNRLSEIDVTGMSLTQLSFIKTLFEFVERHPRYFSLALHDEGVVEFLEDRIQRQAEDFSEFGVDDVDDDDDFDF